MSGSGNRRDAPAGDRADAVIAGVGHVDRAGCRYRDAFRSLEDSLGQCAHHALRRHHPDRVVPGVCDEQVSAAVDRHRRGLRERRLRAVREPRTARTGERAHRPVERHAADDVIAAIGDIQDLVNRVECQAGRLHEDRLATSSDDRDGTVGRDREDPVVHRVGHEHVARLRIDRHAARLLDAIVRGVGRDQHRDTDERSLRRRDEKGDAQGQTRKKHAMAHAELLTVKKFWGKRCRRG